MRVGIGDAERLKVSRLPPHPSGLRPCPPTPSGLQPSPPDRGSRPSPLWGKGFCAAQIGGDWSFCGTFGYIYWELWRSAPVGGGRPSVPPLRRRRGKPGRRVREAAPYKRGGGGKPPPYGFPETVLKLGRGALVLPPETCAREASGRVRAPAPTAYLRTALHIERGTGLGPGP